MKMSKAAWARQQGVSRQTVYEWVRKGQVVLAGNKIDIRFLRMDLYDAANNYPDLLDEWGIKWLEALRQWE